jgi:hypothetical protein
MRTRWGAGQVLVNNLFFYFIGMKKETLLELIGIAMEAKPENSESLFKVGRAYFIRTVTMYYTGKLKKEQDGFLVLEEAAWIPDTGRFEDSIKSGDFSEVEPYSMDLIVNKQSIVDAIEVDFKLPNKQK